MYKHIYQVCSNKQGEIDYYYYKYIYQEGRQR